ncbi:cob(I)yrinic acid a,c-diamide adenosyltransferase [Lentilactobacillus kisonensis]|nr:cob(I)yrinic acid a,c-diamide adenosyltransferase [Lentilactobacillus kisonensis]
MAIYTKGGDKGTTSLFDGKRVSKDSLRVSTYGTFDELNANVSLAEKFCISDRNKQILQRIEYRMFFLQGEIASQDGEKFRSKSRIITDDDVHYLESIIDEYTTTLPKVNSFILPGSSLAGAQLHVCRTVCRRAERQLVSFMKVNPVRPEIERYVNRLSDFMYIMARSEDHEDYLEKVIEKVVQRYCKAIEGK